MIFFSREHPHTGDASGIVCGICFLQLNETRDCVYISMPDPISKCMVCEKEVREFIQSPNSHAQLMNQVKHSEPSLVLNNE